MTECDYFASQKLEGFILKYLIQLKFFLQLIVHLCLRICCYLFRASLLYDFLARISRDLYETIFVGKFPSHEISEKCASHRPQIIDIQSFLPFHRT